MRIGIVGAGAIGCLFGALLGRAGNSVTLVHKDPEVVSRIQTGGVRLRRRDGKPVVERVSARLAPADLSKKDLVIFAVKSHATERAARAHRGRTGVAAVLTIQNGLGNIELLSRFFGRKAVLGGVTTEASFLSDVATIEHTGRGITWIGELDRSKTSRCNEIVGAFKKAGLKSKVSRNITGVVWGKTILNVAINPISAITRLPNGTLERAPGLFSLMSDVAREGVKVAEAEGVEIEPRNPIRLLRIVLKNTARNRSSMLQDVERGKTTEIRELNGAVALLGRKHDIPTPLNTLLANLVVGLESSRIVSRLPSVSQTHRKRL